MFSLLQATASVRVAPLHRGLIQRGVLSHRQPDPLRSGKLKRLPGIADKTFTIVITYRLRDDKQRLFFYHMMENGPAAARESEGRPSEQIKSKQRHYWALSIRVWTLILPEY